jgi:hypothetical protein
MTATPPPAAPVVAYGPRTNSLAIVALVLGILVPVGGIITGHIALGQIKRTGEAGHGLALAGAILGYISCGLFVLTLLGIGLYLLISYLSVAAISGGSTY